MEHINKSMDEYSRRIGLSWSDIFQKYFAC